MDAGTMKRTVGNCLKNIKSRLRVWAIRAGYHSRPSFIIIGAQKSGTSALHGYLSKHPNIVPATKKEIHFFDKDIAYTRGLGWYHSHFPLPHHLGQGAITSEATPVYLYRPKTARRIHEYDPRIRLITLLRDPVERAYSQWNMYRILLRDNPEFLFQVTRDSDPAVRRWADKTLTQDSFHTFDEGVREELDLIRSSDPNPEPSYIRRGLYYDQLTRYLKYFDRRQLLIIGSRSLKTEPASCLDQVVQFLGMPPHDWQREELPLVHTRPYQGSMPARTRALLYEFYRPHNERLYELLGRDFGWERAAQRQVRHPDS